MLRLGVIIKNILPKGKLIKVLSRQGGFTLIEISIVLIITGVLLVGAIKAYEIYEKKRKVEQMNSLMADLDQYIKNFPNMIDPTTVDPATGIGTPFGRFPCPAPMNGTTAGNDYNAEDCTIAPVPGVGNMPVLVGKIPAATLGLNSDFMRDPYNNYLVYAVTRSAADALTYGRVSGAIEVIEEGIDRNPASPTQGEIVELKTHNNVQFVVVSTGDSDAGAYAFDGSQTVACPAATKDAENCNGDASFRYSLLQDPDTPNFYDDRLVFAVNTVNVPSTEEPVACEQFETFGVGVGQSCPEGWSTSENFRPGRNGSFNVDQNVGALREPLDYFNVDPETGDYWISKSVTPHSVINPQRIEGTANYADKLCEKNADNPAKTRCFTKQARVFGGYSSGDNNFGAGSPCPDGWRVVSQHDDGGGLVHSLEGAHRAGSTICGK